MDEIKKKWLEVLSEEENDYRRLQKQRYFQKKIEQTKTRIKYLQKFETVVQEWISKGRREPNLCKRILKECQARKEGYEQLIKKHEKSILEQGEILLFLPEVRKFLQGM